MEELIAYLNSLDTTEQQSFATNCGTSVGYIRKAVSTGQKIGESLCINFERESNGMVRCERVRPDVDWNFIRETKKVA